MMTLTVDQKMTLRWLAGSNVVSTEEADAIHEALASSPTASVSAEAKPFQSRVQPWLMECFGEMIAGDREERNHRFFEEAGELVQACGMSASEAHQLVDYVWNRPIGEKHQEVGGVMVTLAALCLANGLDMHDAAETELARIWTKVEAIRAKQAAKPKHSPLPEHVSNAPAQSIADTAGAKLVPIEPTWEMIAKGSLLALGRNMNEATVRRVWAGMLSVAPSATPPAPSVADAAGASAITDDHAYLLYKLARTVGWADWIKEFRKSVDAAGASEGQASDAKSEKK